MPTTPDQPSMFDLAEAHAMGQLKDEQVHALDRLLLNDAQAREQYALAIELMSMVHEEVRRREEAGEMYTAEPLLKDYDAIFSELLRLEQSADAVLVHVDKPRNVSGFDFREAAGALRYVAARPAVWGSIAAILLIAVVLTFVFSGEDADTTTPPLATDTGVGAEPVADDPSPIVAVLTAERHAVWDRQPEQELYAGQRFTLTQGFAEITTRRGAVAFLQAPATIELINHNALRLHAGKLVGVCETDASKGLLVRTPHMDIVDIGTRFGVDADSRETQVHVLEGEVQALRPDASADIEPTVLATGQSARTSVEVSTIATMDHDADRFAALMPEALRPDAAADWQIVAINGQPLETPGAMKVAKRADSGAPWLTADRSYPQQANAETTFTVQTRFDLPDGVDADTATLTLQFDANDRVTLVHLNGRAFDPPANSNKDGHKGLYTMRIDGPLLQNGNTVQFDVVDVTRNKGTKWRLRAQWTVESITLSQYEEEP